MILGGEKDKILNLKPLKAAFFMRSLLVVFVLICVSKGYAQDLVFDVDVIELGDLKEGTVKKFSFSYHNTSSKAVIIQDVMPQCGCTSIDFEERIVQPLQAGSLMFEFDSSGKEGYLRKTITVLLKGSSPMVLVFTANVITSKKKGKEKPIR